jgi:hypothetical protein
MHGYTTTGGISLKRNPLSTGTFKAGKKEGCFVTA